MDGNINTLASVQLVVLEGGGCFGSECWRDVALPSLMSACDEEMLRTDTDGIYLLASWFFQAQRRLQAPHALLQGRQHIGL